MNDEPTHVVTRDGLRDGSLIAAARLRAPPGTPLRSDAEIEADLDAILASHPPGQDAFLFGYGSLLWNPALHFAERIPATALGWHRRFCLWMTMGRGTPDNPGLMLALERGGACHGALFRIPAAHARDELLLAWRREMFSGAYMSRWVTTRTPDGPVRAMTFVVNRGWPGYAGRLPDARIAERLASASGLLGSCAEYLDRTIGALHEIGLRDRAMERFQASVKKMPPS